MNVLISRSCCHVKNHFTQRPSLSTIERLSPSIDLDPALALSFGIFFSTNLHTLSTMNFLRCASRSNNRSMLRSTAFSQQQRCFSATALTDEERAEAISNLSHPGDPMPWMEVRYFSFVEGPWRETVSPLLTILS